MNTEGKRKNPKKQKETLFDRAIVEIIERYAHQYAYPNPQTKNDWMTSTSVALQYNPLWVSQVISRRSGFKISILARICNHLTQKAKEKHENNTSIFLYAGVVIAENTLFNQGYTLQQIITQEPKRLKP